MMSTTRLSVLLPALTLAASATMVAQAQQGTRPSGSCDGQIIHGIHVTALRPPFTGGAAYWQRVARAFGLHHATTDTAVVRRFLAVDEGGPCTDFRLRESARLLREQPFLADARVRGVRDDSGGVRVEVETIDEMSVLGSVTLGSGRLSYLEIGNENMFGDAWLLAAHYSDRPIPGRSAGFRMTDFQFLGRPYQLDAQLDGGQRTQNWLLAASHGYLTNLQRVAWEAGVQHVGQEFIILHVGSDSADLGWAYRRYASDVGGVFKLGQLRTPILIGGLLTYFKNDPLSGITLSGNRVVRDPVLDGVYPKVTYARMTGIGAWRNLNFITVHGFEAVAATQDVPTGFQLFGQIGKGMTTVGGANDVFLLSDLLAGAGSPTTYVELHVVSEGRHQFEAAQWDGLVSSGRLALYVKPNDLQVVRAWSEFAGGWRVQWPYQLGLATEDQPLIGYNGSLVGGRRVDGGLEYRHVLPAINRRVDVAVGAFVNAAQLWAGGVPFGSNTPMLSTGGISLFGAFPRGSQRLLRVDAGYALHSGIPRSGFAVRVTYRDASRIFRDEPRDIAFAREQLVGPDVFRP